jgi:D-glycero-alpha-D-manno-heptose-7-phosphate kinase
VDLAGGTLDLWPLYNLVGEACTVNLAIDIFTHAVLRPLGSSTIRLDIRDLKAVKEYANLAECLADESPEFSLLRRHIGYWRPTQGFELSTWSESPVGGGLGGSSSLSVTVSGAFAFWTGRKLETDAWVRLVSNVEAQVLRMPTGTQDYYPPILGGLNVLSYRVDGCHTKRFHLNEELFNKSFLLVYTGKPHHSGFNNWQVYKDCVNGEKKTLSALEDLKEISDDLHRMLEAGRWTGLKDIFNREYEARVRISPVFSSPEIERLKEVSLRAGAEAVKICGAGGGGCVLVWGGRRERVAEECRKSGFQVLEAAPHAGGFQIARRPV